MNEELSQRIKARDTWEKGLHILLFAVIYSVAEIIIGFVVLFQFVSTLFTGSRNEQLLSFGRNLSQYVYQIMLFVTYNSDEKPYPFAPWPNKSSDHSPPKVSNTVNSGKGDKQASDHNKAA
ncbi:MAG: DUF4389 domain-containing protein [Gammaproteobacteria bacterium]